MSLADWLNLFLNMAALSLMAIGGAITLAPEMQRYLVAEKAWLTDDQFSASIALAQASPGPNLMFIGLFGWHIGLNSTTDPVWQIIWAFVGTFVCLIAILVPSTTLTFFTAQWAQKNKELRIVKAFKQGMVPLVISMLVATSWILVTPHNSIVEDWRPLLLGLFVALLTVKTQIHILWLLGLGAFLGMLGWI